MTTILVCWLIGVILPYVWAGASLPHRKSQFDDIDLNHPRLQGERLEGAGARAVGAQGNAWEALIVFSVANVAAIWSGVDPNGTWSTLAMVWAVARIGHGIFYLANIAPLRVLSFVTGLVMSIWIFITAL